MVLNPVSATKLPEVALGAPFCHTKTKSLLVENGGDLGLRVVVERAVDFSNGRRFGLVELGGAKRERQVEAVGGAAPKANRGYNLICPEQGDVLQQQSDLFGEVASTPTGWRFLDSIEEPQLERLQGARGRARAREWSGAWDPKRVTLDCDSTLVAVESEQKEQAAPNCKHGFGFHPLLVYLTRPGKPWRAGCDPGMPAPTPPRTTWSYWTRRWSSSPCRPRPRMRTRGWKCW